MNEQQVHKSLLKAVATSSQSVSDLGQQVQKRWSRIKGLKVHHLDAKPNTISHFFELGEIPDNYLWAFRHIIDHDCGCLSCGKTVFEVVYNELGQPTTP